MQIQFKISTTPEGRIGGSIIKNNQFLGTTTLLISSFFTHKFQVKSQNTFKN